MASRRTVLLCALVVASGAALRLPKLRLPGHKLEAPPPPEEPPLPPWAKVLAGVAALLILEVLLNAVDKRKTWLPTRKAHVLVTGGSEGLGKALALALVKKGHEVTVVARTRAKIEAAISDVKEGAGPNAGRILGVVGDVTYDASIRSAVSVAERSMGVPLDAVVCNAGAAKPGLFLDMDPEAFQAQLDVNYLGVVHTVRAALPGMVQRKSGSVVMVSSGLALTGYAGYAAYAPTKWAVRGLAEVLRSELLATGVSVHSVFPPNMATPGFDVENKTKPSVTKAIEAGEPTHDPNRVATAVLAGLERGRFNIACGDFGLGLLVRATAGLAPRCSLFLDMLTLPLIAIIAVFYRGFWDYTVRADARKPPPAAPAGDYFPVLNSMLSGEGSPSKKG